jgi:dephospho-CoA kinase
MLERNGASVEIHESRTRTSRSNWEIAMLIVGLTGGIGSGKSTVANMFAARGVPVIDADAIARDMVLPGSPALEEIRTTFGDRVMRDDSTLDRDKLRKVVFADVEKRRRLEGILHPRILEAMRQRASALDAPYCIMVIPLLFETGQQDLVDRVLVIDASPAEQRRRVMQRDRLETADIDAIMASQVSRERRLAGADDVIRNDAGVEDLEQQVEALHRRYVALSHSAG